MSMTLEQDIRILHPETTGDELTGVLDELGSDITQCMDLDREAILLACEVIQKEVDRRADHSGEVNRIVSNADKIRNMSDEELAKFLLSWIECDKERHLCCPTERKNFGKCDGRCVNGRIDWLRQPAEEEKP